MNHLIKTEAVGSSTIKWKNTCFNYYCAKCNKKWIWGMLFRLKGCTVSHSEYRLRELLL